MKTNSYTEAQILAILRKGGLARKMWRAPTEEPGGFLWETGSDRRRSFGVRLCGRR